MVDLFGRTRTIEVYAETRGFAACRDCGARITFVEVVKTGRRMPFSGEPVALRTRIDSDRRLVEELDLEDSHFRVCGR